MITNKHKDQKPFDVSQSDFLDRLKENSYFQWLVDNRQTIPYLFVALIILFAIAFKFSSGKVSRAESNYLLAENNLALLMQSLQGEEEFENGVIALKELTDITNSYPNLQSRYDGLIAQVLIAMDNPDQAKIFAERSLKRTAHDHLQPFHTFSQITLLIAERAKGQALIESKALKASLLKDLDDTLNPHAFTAHLFAYNLLRIAMLEKEAGTANQEQEAWKEWKKYADKGNHPMIAAALAAIDKQLKEGSFTLDQYIGLRNQAIETIKEHNGY